MMTSETMQTVDISDTELVARSLAGDREAFRQIVERYQTLISSVAYCATGSVSRSEDLAQETFGHASIGGLFAMGGAAIAAISIGVWSVGLLSLGGFAVGGLSLGGIVVGVWPVFGALLIGWQAFNGCFAIAWSAAIGLFALAHDFALGQFARTYVVLGRQYQKLGHPDHTSAG